MKLVDILARELKEWPEHTSEITQSAIDGELYLHGGADISSRLFFAASHDGANGVTRAQWQKAREALISGRHSNLDSPPVGATHYIGVAVGRSKVDIHSWWMREPGDNWYLWAEPSRQWALDTPSARQKNLMKPIHESLRKKEWTGKGMPPVGTVCEFAGGTPCPEDPFDKDLREGMRVTIIAHFKSGDFTLAAFTFDPENTDRGMVQVEQGSFGCFRPIRTPEQIAAEEREKQKSEIIGACLRKIGGANSPITSASSVADVIGALYDKGLIDIDGNQKA
jgi:hypothetical protein